MRSNRIAWSFLRAVMIVWVATLQAAAAQTTTSGPWKLDDVTVEQAWARITPGGSRTGAIYLTIHNKSPNDDLLLAVDSSAAQTTAVHESRIVDGVASMEPLPVGIPMPSHGEVVMRPGGIHIMLTGLSRELAVGNAVPVKMVFQEAGSLEFEVPILPFGAGDPTVKHSGHGTTP
jgi:copper(I)-binding protein